MAAGVASLLLCISFGYVSRVDASAGNVWSYRGSHGPDYWHLDFPHCGGVKQSPISVVTNDVIVDRARLVPFQYKGYGSANNVNMTIQNNGHTVQIDVDGTGIEISGGGLFDTYAAQQFHFHWGAVDRRGSEHDVNGEHFPMEMHIVHYNKKYGNFSNALDKEDGLAVLGFFFKVGRYNTNYTEIIRHFNQISHRDSHVKMQTVPLRSLLPANLDTYYRYQGSLTTPPCYESVTWTLFYDMIEIAEEQLEEFRTKLFESDDSEADLGYDISDDYRPTQCLNSRRVYGSHDFLRTEAEDSPTSGVETVLSRQLICFHSVSVLFVCCWMSLF